MQQQRGFQSCWCPAAAIVPDSVAGDFEMNRFRRRNGPPKNRWQLGDLYHVLQSSGRLEPTAHVVIDA